MSYGYMYLAEKSNYKQSWGEIGMKRNCDCCFDRVLNVK
jgi:hypothetical protein